MNLLWQSFLVLAQPVQFIQISEVAQEPWNFKIYSYQTPDKNSMAAYNIAR